MNLDLVIVLKFEKLEQNKSKKITKFKLLDKSYFNEFLYSISKFDFKNILIFFDNNSIHMDSKYYGKIFNFIKINCYKINKVDEPKKLFNQISSKIKNNSIIINSNFILNYRNKNIFLKKKYKVTKYKFHKDGYLIFPKSSISIIDDRKNKLEKFLIEPNHKLNLISKKILKKNHKLKKAVFLDRDGVINYDYGYIYQWSKFKFRPGVVQGLKYFIRNKYLIFIITNQSGIGRGYFSEKQFVNLHKKLKQVLSKKKIFIDNIQYSPFHPKAKIKRFRKNSRLRKPGNLMIEKIFQLFPVDKNKSFMVGDRHSDEIAARKSRLKFFYAKKNFYSQIKEIDISLKKLK